MYAILVYDINQKRLSKALKTCRVYLNWVQNSVFEGEITEAKLKELEIRMKRLVNVTEDSVMIYKFRTARAFSKQIIGLEKNGVDPFL